MNHFNSVTKPGSQRSWYNIAVNKADDTAEIRIYGEVGTWLGVSAQHFIGELNAITAKNITLHINSQGGTVIDGLAIYNAIKDHPSTVNVYVDGIAASIASVIACAGDTVCIAKNGFLMMHNVVSSCFGYAEDLRREADVSDKLSLALARVYADRTGKPVEEIQKCMKEETWFDSAEAKDFKLVDSIREDEDDAEDLDARAAVLESALKYKNSPEKLRRFAASLAGAPNKPKPKPKETAVADKLNVVERDGKKFVKVGDQEHELVEPAPAAGSQQNQAQVPAAGKTPADVESARSEAVTQEREYRKNFMTAMNAANLAGEAAQKFEETFYGRPIDDVKFLASNAIGARAKGVGEGDGGDEKQKKDAAAAGSGASIEAAAAKRFNAEPRLRQMFGVLPSVRPEEEKYKNALQRFVDREKQFAEDSKPENQRRMSTESREK